MYYFRRPRFILTTLFLFVSMLLYQPVFAGQLFTTQSTNTIKFTRTNLPIAYVTEEQARQLAQEFRHNGFTIKQGSREQLNQILLADNTDSPDTTESRHTAADTTKDRKKDQGCLKDKTSKQTSTKGIETDNKTREQTPGNTDKKQQSQHNTTTDKDQGCNTDKKPAGKPRPSGKEADTPDEMKPDSNKPMPVTMPRPVPPPKPEPKPEPEPAPQTTVQPGVSVDVDILRASGSGGSSGDSAKIFFIVAGIFAVAAFIVYSGKYIVDIVQGKHHDIWWELVFNSTIMDTKAGQHGRFKAVKLATGFVSSDLIQVALVGEAGNADLNLVFNENTTPVILDFTASYWMLGATARLHLSNSLVNASYLYLDFMGGKTNHSETDTIGAARFGASFGINNHIRLGASFGAQYIGLDNNQGFVSNSDKYWYTYGVEMGVQF